MTAGELAEVLMSHTFRSTSEVELQEGIQLVLAGRDIVFEREVDLGRKDRIDFVVAPRIGLEVKIRAGLSEVTRQLHRYAQSDQLDTIVFVTTSSRLCSLLPRTLNGKPIVFASLGGVL